MSQNACLHVVSITPNVESVKSHQEKMAPKGKAATAMKNAMKKANTGSGGGNGGGDGGDYPPLPPIDPDPKPTGISREMLDKYKRGTTELDLLCQVNDEVPSDSKARDLLDMPPNPVNRIQDIAGLDLKSCNISGYDLLTVAEQAHIKKMINAATECEKDMKEAQFSAKSNSRNFCAKTVNAFNIKVSRRKPFDIGHSLTGFYNKTADPNASPTVLDIIKNFFKVNSCLHP